MISSAITQGVVTVKVGPDSIKYNVHKAMLVHHSEYFKKALNGSWKEAEENMVTPADIEPKACKL